MADIAPSAGGVAISGGDFAGTDKDGAFDDSLGYLSGAWASVQTNISSPNQVDAPAYIGYDFGAGNLATITSLNLWQHPSITGNSLLEVNSIALEWSDDGATGWTELDKVSPTGLHDYEHTVSVPVAKRAWRLRALANVTGGAGSIWAVRELDLHGSLGGGGGGGGGFGGLGLGGRGRGRGRRR